MFVKFLCLLTISFVMSYSQGIVNISGTVSDSYSDAPIKGASVRLVGKNSITTTDTNGNFSISGTSVMNARLAQPLLNAQFIGKRGFVFRNDIGGNVEIRIFDIAGKKGAVLFSGKLGAGMWHIPQPQTGCGIFLCRINTPKETYAIKFLSTGISGRGNLQGITMVGDVSSEKTGISAAKINVGSSEIDSLFVTKSGFFQTVIPLDNVYRSGMNILLTDSTIAHTATIVPDSSWTCSMAFGIPPPQLGDLVFKATLQIGGIHVVGFTQYGFRRILDVKGGTIAGNRINATVLAGGLDLALTLPNGSIELEQINVLRTSDNTLIFMRNGGVAPAGDPVVRVVPDFEAPNSSSFAWLNNGKFAATRVVNVAAGTIVLDVYDISKVTMPDKRIKLKDPSGLPNQSWDCLTVSGTKGANVFTETVTLGSSLLIGASKRGTRNIIPITGGTVTGRVTGKVISGGADYQLSDNSHFDARYTLMTDDSVYICIRNCGVMGALVPTFETRTDAAYVFLNSNTYLSSDPGSASGGVKITISERK